MKTRYRRLNNMQVEELKGLVMTTLDRIKDDNSEGMDQYRDELKELFDCLNVEEPGLDELTKAIHDLKNEITGLKLQIQMMERKQ